MQRCTMKTLLLAIFGLQCSSSECIFETEDLNFFHQVEELYNQVDRATDIEKLLSGEGGGGQLDTLERFCSCQVAGEAGEANTITSSEPVPLSLLCQAVVWLRLSDDHDHQRLGHGLRRVTTHSRAQIFALPHLGNCSTNSGHYNHRGGSKYIILIQTPKGQTPY